MQVLFNNWLSTLYGVVDEHNDFVVGDEGVVRTGLLTVNGDKLKLSLVEGELGCFGLFDVLVLLITCKQIYPIINYLKSKDRTANGMSKKKMFLLVYLFNESY